MAASRKTGKAQAAFRTAAPGPDRRGSKATITDVAERAGVSIKTVSRVINREASVREATREKVLAAAEALNYQPNPSARGLAGNRSFSIGMLYNNPTEFGYVKDNLYGAFSACRELGYSLLLHPCEEVPDVEEVLRFLQQTGVDGLILAAPVCEDAALLQVLNDRRVPYAQIAPSHPAATARVVQCDDYRASYAITDYLIAFGHRRIGFIKGDPGHGSSVRRYEGFRDCLKQHHISQDRTLIRQGRYDFESGNRCGFSLLRLKNRPTAIVASNDDMAAGVLHAAHELGISIPQELSVTGFDDTQTARHSWPPLTTVHQPIVEMSFAAAEMLIDSLNSRESGSTVERVFECDLIIRESTGPAADRKG